MTTISLACAATAALVACSDDPTPATATPADGGSDSSTTATDAGGTDVVTTPPDGGGDGNNDAGGGDGGLVVATSFGPTASLRILPDAIFADFSEDDTIVRLSSAPECVIHVRGSTKPYSPAGTITVGGPIVGSDGGTDQPIALEPDPADNRYVFFGPVFAPDGALTVQVESLGTASVPAIPVQVIPPPAPAPVAITKPAVPDGGAAVEIPTTAPFEIAWTVPADATGKHLIFWLAEVAQASGAKTASLFCSYPLSAGQAKVPTEVLSEVKSRVGGSPAGFLFLNAGGYKALSAGGASYVMAVTREDSTSFSMEVGGATQADLK